MAGLVGGGWIVVSHVTIVHVGVVRLSRWRLDLKVASRMGVFYSEIDEASTSMRTTRTARTARTDRMSGGSGQSCGLEEGVR